MTYSLDQRLYNLKLNKKDLHEICVNKGLEISYGTVCVWAYLGHIEHDHRRGNDSGTHRVRELFELPKRRKRKRKSDITFTN